MDDATVVHRLRRRLGFGPLGTTPAAVTPSAVADELLAPADAPGSEPDPWGSTDHTITTPGAAPGRMQVAMGAVAAWVQHMATTEAPLPDRVAWTWHGHFVSALPEVKNPQFLVEQMRLFRTAGLAGFRDLLRSVTIDAAMLRYLDGYASTGEAPNENYSREVLELFTIRTGYTEADVAAGARALSGWRMPLAERVPVFVPRRHDDAPQTYLGRDGVHDLDTVVDAIVAHPALAPALARTWAVEVVGPAVGDDVVAAAADAFVASGLSIGALVRALAGALVGGADGGEVVAAPLPWFVAARRITGAAVPARDVLPHLVAAGQVPWLPPNVSGWPSGAAWQNASTLVARVNIAAQVAAATPESSPLLAAADLESLRLALQLPAPWSASTAAALGAVTDPRERLTLALVAPEFVAS